MIRLICVGLAGMGKHHWSTAAKRSDTKGVLKVSGDDILLQTFAGMAEQKPEQATKAEPAPVDAWGAFAESIATRKPSLTASGENMKSLHLMFAAIRSAHTGTLLPVDRV